MSLSIGIVGLPNVGKSTLFNALLKRQQALAANYPFATIEPNMGIVDVPDYRLDKLAQLVKDEHQAKFAHKDVPEKVIPSTVKFYDIAGLVKGAHQGEGLGNQFLGHIREVDAIVHVIRGFSDQNVIREGSQDPKTDLETINLELILADFQAMEQRIEKINADIKRKRTSENLEKLDLYTKVMGALEKEQLISTLELSEKEKFYLKELNLLTSKPIIYVLNVDEDAFLESKNNPKSNESTQMPLTSSVPIQSAIKLCAKLEAEIIQLSPDERKEYLEELGIKASGLDKVITQGYRILDLQDFFTAGPKEVRAWTIKKGTKAPQAAGKIHTDFERGFISADIISFKNLIEIGSYKAAKEKGLVRLEGKNYTMQDGDVVEFRFGV